MANKSKVVDMAEAVQWLEEGRPYGWIQEQYREKYNVDTSISMWSNMRRALGIPGRQVRDAKLIPWTVSEEHKWRYPIIMLRLEARRRAGGELSEREAKRLESWLSELEDEGGRWVVRYVPDTDEGFFLVRPREGVDTDLIWEERLQ